MFRYILESLFVLFIGIIIGAIVNITGVMSFNWSCYIFGLAIGILVSIMCLWKI